MKFSRLLKHFIIFFTLLILVLGLGSLTVLATPAPQISDSESQNQERLQLVMTSSIETPIYLDRVLYLAFKELNIDISVILQGMTSSIISVNSGVLDGIMNQTAGLEESYPNLVMVNVPVTSTDFLVYTKNNFFGAVPTTWSDFKDKKVGSLAQKHYVESHVSPYTSEYKQYVSLTELFAAVENGEIDYAIHTDNLSYYAAIPPLDVKMLTCIDSIPLYPYLNKKYAPLVPALEKILLRLKEDGIVEKVYKNAWPPFSESSSAKVMLNISSFSPNTNSINPLQTWINEKNIDRSVLSLYDINMNSLHLSDDIYRRQSLSNALHSDFLDKTPNLIMVSDNEALDFIKEFYPFLFLDTPVVFSGINDFSANDIEGYEKFFTGLTQEISASDTVELMLNLFPNTKKIHVLNDYTTTGKKWRSSIERQLNHFQGTVDIEYNENISFQALTQKMKSIGPDELILVGFYYVDSKDTFTNQIEFETILGNTTDVPIFGLYASSIGYGQLGGKYIDSEAEAERAIEIAESILAGKKVSDIPVENVSYLNKWIFDYTVMKKYDISKHSLPSGSIIVNEPQTIFEVNPIAAGLLLTSIFAATIIIVLLTYFFRRLKRQNNLLVQAQNNLHTVKDLLKKDMELEQNKTDLQNVLDSLAQAVIIRTLENEVKYVNNAYLRLFNIHSKDEALQYSTLRLSPQFQPDGVSSADRIKQNNKMIMTNKKNLITFDWRFQTLDGKILDAYVSGMPILYDGVTCLLMSYHDVTIDRLKEESLRITAQQEHELSQIKSRFVVNMSHEIRTPMNAVIGLSEIALLKNFDGEAQDTFRKINSSAKHLLSIINDVLDFSKIEAEKLELFEENFSLEEVLSNAMLVTSERIKNKKVEMLLDMDINVPDIIKGDKTRIWQIFKNILDNSAKFTFVGHIILKVRFSVDEHNPSQIIITFTISDTGAGMEDAQLNKIYIPFEQFHQDASNLSTGTGLGMSITKQLVELMNGSIHVESKVGVGTTTTIAIPFKIPPHSVSLRSDMSKTNLSGYKVLVADDDAISLEICQTLLVNLGGSVVCASSGTKALEHFEIANKGGNPYDLIILDYLMGDMTGVDVAKIMQEVKIKNCKILMATAYSAQILSTAENAKVFDGIIEKPFSPSQFSRKISEALHSKTAVTQPRRKLYFENASVLVVEDNEINQEVVKSMLTLFGITPDVAENGQDALNMLEVKQYDLIFMDLLMPIMDGHTATKTIRESDKPYRDTPIIAMTANVVKEEISRCLEEGMNGHIGKPIDLNNLSTYLSQILADKQIL